MPSKWVSLKTFERQYIDHENEESVLHRIIALGASGDLEVKAGFWTKTHYEEIRNTSLDACLQKIHYLTHEEKNYVRDFSESASRPLQHIRVGVSYLTIYRARGSISILVDVTERHPLQHVEVLPSFWDDAYIDLEGHSIVFMDRTNLQRTIASQICLDRSDLERAFNTHVSLRNKPRRGRPAGFYADKGVQTLLKDYFGKNIRKKNVVAQFQYARELCRKGGFPVSDDMTYQVERKLRKRLLLSFKGDYCN